MAKVLVVAKVFPNGVDIDFNSLVDDIRKKLPEGYDIAKTAEEPIAFGYKALKLYVVIPEETEGGTDTLEEILKNHELIDEVEIEAVHRLSEF
ncbi:MAG: elongation factor 1-beta [Desulfurococcales archaeon]|nr:elongation factor 1-beta [Desulfurococcales archaeon]